MSLNIELHGCDYWISDYWAFFIRYFRYKLTITRGMQGEDRSLRERTLLIEKVHRILLEILFKNIIST